jgi:hypothetical protein
MKTKHTKTGNPASVILTTLLLAMALPCAASSILYDSTAGGTSLGDLNNIQNGDGLSYISGSAYQGSSDALLGQISFGLAMQSESYTGGTFTLFIYEFSGSDPLDGQSPVYTQDFTAALQTNTTSMFPVTLDTPYEITANQKFGIGLKYSGSNAGAFVKWSQATAQDTSSPLSLSNYGFYTTNSGATFGAYGMGNGRAVTLSTADISAVPETSTSLGLLALGAGGLLTRRRFILKA